MTNIKFDLPEDINVILEVYNINGILIIELQRGIMDAGYHSIIWNANRQASGIYFVKMIAGNFVSNQKLMLVK